MMHRAQATLLAGLLALMPLAQASDCKSKPLAELTPAPERGVFHIGRPYQMVASSQGEVLITVNGWDTTSVVRGTQALDARLIVWDGATMTPRHVFAEPAKDIPLIPGTMTRSGSIVVTKGLFYPASVSPDGRYLAFSLGEDGARCVDVYENGRLLARYPNRAVITFYGEQLLLVDIDKKGQTRGIFLQPPGDKLVKKSLDMMYNGKRQKSVSSIDGIFQINGQGVVGTTTFASNGSARYGRVDLGPWQPQPSRIVLRDNVARVRSAEKGSDHYKIELAIPGLYQRATMVPLALQLSPSIIKNRDNISAFMIGDNMVLAMWGIDHASGSGKQTVYAQAFFADTGLPVHPVPLRLPEGYEANSLTAAHALALDDEHLLLMPPPHLYLPAEKVNLFTGQFQQVAIMQPPADARRLAEATQARAEQLQAQAAALRQREAALNSIPIVRKVHEQGGAADGYEAELYCRMGGPRCAQVRQQVRAQQDARNKKAFADQMRRAWELHSDGVDVFFEGRKRAECLRRRDNPTAIADPEFAGKSVGACPR